jgi:hypothetical protein
LYNSVSVPVLVQVLVLYYRYRYRYQLTAVLYLHCPAELKSQLELDYLPPWRQSAYLEARGKHEPAVSRATQGPFAHGLYVVLGVERSATPAQIKKAYYQLILRWHPDKNPAPEAIAKFREIQHAYETLSDPDKRERYDQHGEEQQHEEEEDIRPYNFYVVPLGSDELEGTVLAADTNADYKPGKNMILKG